MKLAASSAAVVVALALCGCGGVPKTHYYVLQAHHVAAAEAFGHSGQRGRTVGVHPLQVDPPYDQDRIVYRIGEASAEIGFYAYHRWATPLSRMLPRVMAAGLTGLSGVERIEPVVPGREYDAYLGGRVISLEEIDTSDGPTVQVQLMITLFDANGDELWSQTVVQRAVVPGKSVAEVVDGMSDALTDALTALRPGLENALR